MKKIVAILVLLAVLWGIPALASGAACETIIWGNRVASDGAAAAALVTSGMVDPNTAEGRAWLENLNAVLADSAAKLEALMDAIPTQGAKDSGRPPKR